jgi:LacI family transcriptional regulator
MRRPTIQEVAKRAGVSPGSVSKAFANKPEISAETRQRILKAAADIHFTPNALIRSLQRGSTNTIGICTWTLDMPSLLNGISMSVLDGIAKGVSETHQDILIYAEYQGRAQMPLATTFLDGRVDGVICSPHLLTEDSIEQLARSGFPAVILYNERVPEAFGTVTIDNIGGVRSAVDHLVQLGHRRIAFHAPRLTYDYQQRSEGYRQGLRANGIAFDPGLCAMEDSYTLSIPEIYDWLSTRLAPPTALIAGDDDIAFQWMEELARRNVRVPESLSVVGFDDAPRAQWDRGLSTVRQDAVRVGRSAVHLVCQMMRKEDVSERRIQLPVEFVARNTTAPPRGRAVNS